MNRELATSPLTGESLRAAISESTAVQQAFLATRNPAEWTKDRRAMLELLAYAPPNVRDFEQQPPGGAWDFNYAYHRAALVFLEIHDNAERVRKARAGGGA